MDQLPENLTKNGSFAVEICAKAEDITRQYNLFFVSDLLPKLEMSQAEFDVLLPPGSDMRQRVERQLETNRVNTKTALRRRLFQGSQTSASDIALYKLLGTDEELARLSADGLSQYEDRTKFNELLNNMDDDEFAL